MRWSALSIIFFLAMVVDADAISYKRKYCNNQEFFTDAGAEEAGTYPHLHCGRRWITYSKSGRRHYNFVDGSGVKTGIANNACRQAASKGANRLKSIINRICQDDGATCGDCD